MPNIDPLICPYCKNNLCLIDRDAFVREHLLTDRRYWTLRYALNIYVAKKMKEHRKKVQNG